MKKPAKLFATICAAAATSLLLMGLGTTSSAQAKARTSPKATTYKYTFVFDNNFLGNDYRPQLLRLGNLTAQLPPFKGVVKWKEVESVDTTAAQIADVYSIIATHPTALLLEPASPTALAPAVNAACAAGIIVVDIDQTAHSPCAYTVAENFYNAQYVIGEWMAAELHNKGSVFLDQGLPGPNISSAISDGFLAGLKAASGGKITVAAKYAGDYANAPSEEAIASLLPAHRGIAGIMNQGYCQPAFTALAHAGLKPVPATCFGYNGSLEVCAEAGHACAIETGSPTGIQVGMTLALALAEHHKTFLGTPIPPKSQVIPNPQYIYVTNASQFHPAKTFGVNIAQIKAGVNFYPSLPPGVALPLTLPQYAVNAKKEAGE